MIRIEPFAAWLNEVNVSDQLGNRVLNDMIEDELVRAKAEELGVTVTDANSLQATGGMWVSVT